MRIILAVMLLINSHRALLYGVGWFLTHCEVSSKEACRRWILIYDGRVRALRCGAQRERFDERMCMITRDTIVRTIASIALAAGVCIPAGLVFADEPAATDSANEETYRPAEITDEEVADVLSAFSGPTTPLFRRVHGLFVGRFGYGGAGGRNSSTIRLPLRHCMRSIRPSTLLASVLPKRG
ncbi:MAG: hypothetical protein ACLTQI_07280 [Slackia sp.]